jgi:hypothetical protein
MKLLDEIAGTLISYLLCDSGYAKIRSPKELLCVGYPNILQIACRCLSGCPLKYLIKVILAHGDSGGNITDINLFFIVLFHVPDCFLHDGSSLGSGLGNRLPVNQA